MSKRFIDTELFSRDWFMALSPAQKCAFFYILTRCDAVGVWKPNLKLAEYQIGSGVDWEALRADANGNIRVLPNGKWWLADFCHFQYGALSAECRPHQSYLALLSKHGLLRRVTKGYGRGSLTPKEKEKDKDKEQEREKEREKERRKWRAGANDGRVLYPPARCPHCEHVLPGHAKDCPTRGKGATDGA